MLIEKDEADAWEPLDYRKAQSKNWNSQFKQNLKNFHGKKSAWDYLIALEKKIMIGYINIGTNMA